MAEEAWDEGSQSLGGFQEYEQPSASFYTGAAEDWEFESTAEEADFAFESYAVLVEEGLDESNSEAVDYAIEVI